MQFLTEDGGVDRDKFIACIEYVKGAKRITGEEYKYWKHPEICAVNGSAYLPASVENYFNGAIFLAVMAARRKKSPSTIKVEYLQNSDYEIRCEINLKNDCNVHYVVVLEFGRDAYGNVHIFVVSAYQEGALHEHCEEIKNRMVDGRSIKQNL